MKKQIAIFGWKTGDNSYGITVPYYDYLSNYGDVNILSPVQKIDFSKYDLLVVPGGPDISPNTYGHVPSMSTGKSDPIREYFDKYMLPKAINTGIPILGICRGHQSIAVHFGGNLIQDMYHETTPATNRFKTAHEIDIYVSALPSTLGEAITKEIGQRKALKGKPHVRSQEVNSLHHQVVSRTPENSVILATHYHDKFKDDKSVEALYYPDNNIFTFQYHPEEIWDTLSMMCVDYLLSDKIEENVGTEEESIELAG